MNDGTISGNTVTNSSVVHALGGGVFVFGSGVFTMNGGTISGNRAEADGVKAKISWGGGVSVHAGGRFIMKKGTIRDNNEAIRGGGVSVGTSNKGVNSSFKMHDGTISDNQAAWGGGVVITGLISGGYNNPSFEMTGGTISGNTNSSDTDGGGGVAAAYGAIFTMSGGTIGGNISNTVGGGVSIASDPDDGAVTFTKTGESVIYGNETSAGLTNTATTKQGGSAVHVQSYDINFDVGPTKRRETTVGTGVNLYWPLKGNGDPTDDNWEDPSQP
jgi:hypothetical protein